MSKPKSIKTTDLEPYQGLDLHQLEARLLSLQTQPDTTDTKHQLRVLRQVLRDRQRLVKAQAMEFELTNNRHLLVFDSTDHFAKIAGRSVLFYTNLVADRLHRRYNIKNDTDDYSPSEDGIISLRDLATLERLLPELNIFPDPDRSTTELHFYKLPRLYTDAEILKFRDRSLQDLARITSIIVPASPVPALYNLILELNRLIFYNSKRATDPLAREYLFHHLISPANSLLASYLNFANARGATDSTYLQSQTTIFPQPGLEPHSAQAHNLFNLLLHARTIRNNAANVENLRLIHRRELAQILEAIVEIERIASREYTKQIHQDRRRSTAPKVQPSKTPPSKPQPDPRPL